MTVTAYLAGSRDVSGVPGIGRCITMTGVTVEAVGITPGTVGTRGRNVTGAGAVVIGDACEQVAIGRAIHVVAARGKSVAFGAIVANTTITGILGRIVTADDGMDRVGTRVTAVWHPIISDRRRVAVTIVTGSTAGRHEATDRLIVIVTGLAVGSLVVGTGTRPVVMSGCRVTSGADRLQVRSGDRVERVEIAKEDGAVENLVPRVKWGVWIYAVLFGLAIMDHGDVAATMRIVTRQAGFTEVCLLLQSVANISIVVSHDPDSRFGIT